MLNLGMTLTVFWVKKGGLVQVDTADGCVCRYGYLDVLGVEAHGLPFLLPSLVHVVAHVG